MSTRYHALLSRMQQAILANSADAAELLVAREDFPVRAQMHIYQNGYRVRMAKVVRDDYPALASYTGEETIARWVQAYIDANPSTHYNLDTYPLGFADFVATQTDDSFAQQLAVLEGTIKDVYMMPESPALDPGALGGAPDALVIAPRTASQLLTFDYPVNVYLSDFRLHGKAAAPALQKTFCFVYRHRHNVRRADLSAEEHGLMQALSHGRPLSSALEAVAHLDDTTVQSAFTRFVSEGMLTL